MMQTIQRLLEMIRFSHTIFALPFALLAAVMAWTAPAPDTIEVGFSWRQLLGVLICMVAARSAAMAFNRLADRKIDGENPRTKNRHLPAGLLSVAGVWFFLAVMSVGFVAGALLFLPNILPVILAVPVLLFLMGYSYAKRFTSLAHFWLGAALSLSPMCVWIALRGEVLLQDPLDGLPAVALGFAVLLWVSGFDIIYACQDFEYDSKARLRSVPTALGIAGALRLAAVCHAATVATLAMVPLTHFIGGPQLPFGWMYWCALAVVAALLVYEHALVRPDDLTRVNVAFFHVNSIISFGLFAVGFIDLLWL